MQADRHRTPEENWARCASWYWSLGRNLQDLPASLPNSSRQGLPEMRADAEDLDWWSGNRHQGQVSGLPEVGENNSGTSPYLGIALK